MPRLNCGTIRHSQCMPLTCALSNLEKQRLDGWRWEMMILLVALTCFKCPFHEWAMKSTDDGLLVPPLDSNHHEAAPIFYSANFSKIQHNPWPTLCV